MKKNLLFALLLLTTASSLVCGATMVWTNTSGGAWTNAANWSPNQVPGNNDNVAITNSGDYAVTVNVTTTIATLALGGSSGTQALSIAAANLTINGLSAINAHGILNLQNHTVTVGSPLHISGLLNWTGGNFEGALNVLSNGVVQLSSSTTKGFSDGVLTNAGTIIYGGTGSWGMGNASVYNLTGALFDLQDNGNLYYWFGAAPVLHNGGVLRKSGGTGTSSFGSVMDNTGAVEVQTGTINFGGGGTYGGQFDVAGGATLNISSGGAITGIINAASGATVLFSGGNFGVIPTSSLTGAGTYRFSGGQLLLEELITNLQLTGGTTRLSPAFQGGTITNLTISGTTLVGTNQVSGTLRLLSGSIDGPLTVASGGRLDWQGGSVGANMTVAAGGVVELSTATTKGFSDGVLTNAGTIIYGGTGSWGMGNASVYNLLGALFDLQSNGNLYYWFGSVPTFHNAGLLRKSAGTGTSSFGAIMDNTGTIEVQTGTINFGGGGTYGGEFNVAAGATLNISSGGNITGNFNAASGGTVLFSGGTFGEIPTSGLTGAGTYRFTGGQLTLNALIPNLQLTGGTVRLSPSFQGGTITNLTISGTTLVGTNQVTGMLRLLSGTIDGPLTIAGGGQMDWQGGSVGANMTVASGGMIQLSSTSTKGFSDGVLTNAGTIIYGGSGSWGMGNASVYNLPGALFDLQDNGNLYHWFGSVPIFHNAGLLRKSAGVNTSSFGAIMDNTGTVEIQTGTINFGGGGTYGGQFNIAAGATLNISAGGAIAGIINAASGATVLFSGGNFGVIPTSSLTGLGTYRFSGGQLLLEELITNLQLTGGTTTLSPTFQGGTITNLTISGTTLVGTNQVTGTLRLLSGSIDGPLTIASGGLLDWQGGSVGANMTVATGGVIELSSTTTKGFSDGALTNAGTIIYGGTGSWGMGNASVYNLPGALFDLQSNGNLYHWFGSVPSFHNAGLLRKSAGTGTSSFGTIMDNTGTIEIQTGIINPGSTYTQTNGTLRMAIRGLTDYGRIALQGTAPLTGTLSVYLAGGYLPAVSNKFSLVTYTSFSSAFASEDLPDGFAWLSQYGPTAYSITVLGACTPPPTGLIAWWPGDGNANDLIGANHGSPRNGAGFSTGLVRQAFDLDGADDYVEAPDSAALDFGAGDFSIALAANFRSVRSSSLGNPAAIFVGHDEGSGGQNKWFFALGGDALNFHINGPAIGARFLAQAPFTPVIGVWYHLALTRSNGVYRVFTNGVQVSSEADATPIPAITAPITLGQAENIGYMDGRLDEVIIVNRALTPAELTAIRTSGDLGLCRPTQPPIIVAQPQSRTNAPGTTATFSVTAAGSAPLSYQWFFDGSPLSDGGRISGALSNTLTIASVQLADAGLYSVTVSNAAGATNSFPAQLTVDGNAPIISQVATNPGVSQCIVSWQTDEAATAAVEYGLTTAYGSTNRFNGSLRTQHALTLTGLIPGTTYHFRVRSVDAVGNETISVDLTFTTLPAPDLRVVNVSVSSSGPIQSGAQLTIRWVDTNSGLGIATDNWHDRVQVVNTTTSASLLDTTVLHATSLLGALTNGGSRLRQYVFRLPDGPAGTGPLRATITADYLTTVVEFNETGTAESNNIASTDFSSTLAAYPDLAIDSFIVNPATFESGRQVTVDWVLTNLGTAPVTGDFYDRVRVRNTSLNTTPFDQTFYLNPPADAEGPIGVEQSRHRTASFKLPDGAAGVGNIEVALFLDSDDRIFEYHTGIDAEANNTTNIVRSSTLALYPDLVVTNVIAPATGLPGQSIDVTWTVTNAGALAAVGPWTDQIFLVDDAPPNTAQLLGSFTFDAILEVGASSNVTRSVVLPFFTVGTRRVAVRANSGDAFYEPNFANNYRASASTITLSPRLELTLNRANVSENGGTNSVIGTILRNSSTANSLTVTLAVSDTNTVQVPAMVIIPAGQASRTFALALIDNDLVDSNRTVTLSASAANFASSSVNLLVENDDVPTLALELAPEQINEDAGPAAAIGLLTRNTATNSSLVVTVVSDSPTHLLPPPIVTIPAGERSVTFEIEAPVNTTVDGVSDVRLQASAAGFRTASANVIVLDNDTPALGLTLAASAIAEGAESPATTGTISRNPPLTLPLNVVLQQSLRGLLLIPSELTIPAGQSQVSFNVSVTDDQLVNGTRIDQLIARVRSANGPPLTNGQSVFNVTVYDNDGPTLTLALARDVVAENGSVSGTVTRNTAGGNLVVTLTSSAPGEALPATATVTINNGQSSANFSINGVPDGVNDGIKPVIITASASGYNSATAGLNVSDIDLPDLSVGDIIVPSSGQINAKANVTFTVANAGPVAANGTWIDRVYISTDNQLGGDTLAGAVTNAGPLAPNSSYTRTVSITLPPDPGVYHVIVVTDSDDQVTEGSERNNVISLATIDVQPNYRATVETDIATAPCGTPIPIRGRAFNPDDDSPARAKLVTVRIRSGGTRRLYNVFTDLNGLFQMTFTPLPTEVGDYELAADHPRVTTDTPQDVFSLLGFGASADTATITIVPQTVVTGQVTLRNLTGVALTGIAATVSNVPSALGLTLSVPAILGGYATGTLDWSLNTSITNAARVVFPVTITSAEGCSQRILFTVNIAPLQPQLVAVPGFADRGMVRGQQAVVPVTVRNVGGVSSGPMNISLPDVSWLKLAGTNQLGSLEPGASTTVNVLLDPPADLPLLVYNGSIGLGNGRVGLALPYRFRALSTALGDLVINATDDYTYYVAGNPKLTNAAVTVSDPFTGQVVTNGVTDVNGVVRFVGLQEGAYTVDVNAPKHNTFRGTATIQPGVESSLEAFLLRQTVTYQWSVVPVEIQDRYRIVLEPVFETEVPIPNLIIEEPFIMPLVFEGETNQFDLLLRNEGLIAAENVEIKVPDHPAWVLEPLVSKVGAIPAKSRLAVPVLIHRRAPGEFHAGFVMPSSINEQPSNPDCQMDTLPCMPKLKMGVVYSYKCGPNGVEKSVGADLSPLCLAKSIKECIENAITAAGSGASLASGGNIANAACDMIQAILACSGVELSSCQSAALSIACGALTGGLAGAAGGAAGGSTLSCICELVGDISISIPPAEPNYGQVNYVDGGLIGSNPSGFNGIPWSVGYLIGPQNCANSSPANIQPVGEVTPASIDAVAATSQAPGVCARVRLQINQEAVMTRVAFKGSLEIDNNSEAPITGIRVSIDIRDSDGNPAGNRFVAVAPTVSGMGDVDGNGVVPAAGNGAAEYLFIPTRDAAPTAPAVYRIGGSLHYTDNGQDVVLPLLSAPITVYPEALLQLRYFQSRNVYSDDPFTDEIEPSEPFALGLIAKNIGAGAARNFHITSAQPKIIENEKGLLIDFKIIGSQVGTNAAEPTLTANLGTIPAGQSQVAQWLLTSSLQGKFIEYKATFEHVDNFGSTNLSLIDSVEVHELIKPVLADRLGDDLAPDFLVNDIPDPDSLPDILYFSNGSTASVEPLTSGAFSNPIGAGVRQTTLTFSAPLGWVYLRLPDPGPGWQLHRVVRSDNKELKVGNNTWTTDRTFPSAITGVVRTHEFHLLDFNSTGSYTVYYRPVDKVPPTLVSVGPVTPAFQTAPVNTIDVLFSEEVDPATFTPADVSLTLNGGPNLIGVTVTQATTNRFTIGGLASLTAADGNYELTVNAAGIEDFGGNPGLGIASTRWAKGSLAPVVTLLGPILPNPRNTPVDSLEVAFSRAINGGTFGPEDITLKRSGGPNLITVNVQITQIETNRFIISGLSSLTQAAGEYVLTVNATGVQDIIANTGTGAQTTAWTMITSGPQILSLEHLATNPRSIVVSSLDVTFAAPINPATFSWQDLTLTRNSGPNLITSAVTIQQISPTLYRIANFNWVVGQEGTYTFIVNAASILDPAGNPGAGSAAETWLMDTTRPPGPTSLVLSPDLGVSNTDKLINLLTPTLSGQLAESNLTVRVKDLTTGSDLGTAEVVGQAFTKQLSLVTAGAHQLQVRCTDAGGNTASPDAVLDLFVDLTQPSAELAPVTPALRSTPVNTIDVAFSEAINSATFTREDLTLRRQGGANLINAGVQVVNVVSNLYQITGLATLTDIAGSYQFTLNMGTVEDRAGNAGTNAVSVAWSRTGDNQPPTIAIIPDRSVAVGEAILFTNVAHDPDPGQKLTFTLNPDAPANARLGETSGVFLWNPTRSQAPGSYSITITVTDDGVPPASASRTFNVSVGDFTETSLDEAIVLAGEDGALNLALISTAGLTNLAAEVLIPTNRLSVPRLGNVSSLVRTAAVQVLGQGRYRLNLASKPGQSIRGSNVLAQLQFGSDSNQSSAFIPLPLSNLAARQPDGTVVGTTFTRNGRVVMIGPQPLLELGGHGPSSLRLFGRPGEAYDLEETSSLGGAWSVVERLRFNTREQRRSVDAHVGQAFFRLASVDVSTPFLEILSRDAAGTDIAFYAQRGLTFDLQTTPSLAQPWAIWYTQPMTNSFHEFRLNFGLGNNQFLRAKEH